MPGAKNIDEHEGVRHAVMRQAEAGRLVGAICAGPMVLGLSDCCVTAVLHAIRALKTSSKVLNTQQLFVQLTAISLRAKVLVHRSNMAILL